MPSLRLSSLAAPALVIALAILAPSAARAWDAEGHRIIAHLAYERLTPKAKAEIATLIGHSAEQATPRCPVVSIEDASTWPDCVRPDSRWSYLARDHFEDVPLCGTKPLEAYCPDGQCIVPETRRAIAVLKDSGQPTVQRLQALEEVVHFIGDMHQPLHAADNNDRGGNDVPAMVGAHWTNLHHVWDTEALEYAVGPDETNAEAALRPLIARNAVAWSSGDLDAWLAQTHRIAVTYVYAHLQRAASCGEPAPSQTITEDYLDGAAPIVRQQLGRAAVRLARVLNEALG